MPARRLPTRPGQRASRVKRRAITRALWPLSGTCTFLSISWSNVQFILSVISIWIGILSLHEVEQNKCKHDPQLSYNNMDDVFELLIKQNVYVQGVWLIPVGFQTKLNTFFWHSRGLEEKMREWGRKSFAFLQGIPKYSSGSLVDTMTISWRAFQMNSTTFELSSLQDT